MMTHCAAIREAYKAILADWATSTLDTETDENQLVHQTAILASVQLDDTVSDENVREVLRLNH